MQNNQLVRAAIVGCQLPRLVEIESLREHEPQQTRRDLSMRVIHGCSFPDWVEVKANGVLRTYSLHILGLNL